MKNTIFLLLLAFTTQLYSQNIRVYKVQNTDNSPQLQWFETGKNLQAKNFSVWRTSLAENKFDSIQTLHYTHFQKKDSLIYTVLDTTLTEKAIYKYYIKFEEKGKKTLTSNVIYGHNMGYIASPKVVSLKAKSSQSQKAIELNWQLNNDFSVRSLSIFRSSHHEKGFKKIVELAGDATNYTDIVPLSNHNYFYFILIADYFGYQQPSTPTPGYCSFKQKPYPPQNLNLKKEENIVQLSWNNIQSNLAGYKVYRAIGNAKYKALHSIQTSNKLQETYIDSISKQLEKNELIHYYVVNIGDAYVDSNPSDTLSVFLKKDIKSLALEEFDALIQKDNQVQLIWSFPKQSGIKGYNLYLTKPTLQKLNKNLIPLTQNHFTDTTNRKSGQYTYALASINNKNQVSEYKNKTSLKILPPYFHLIVNTNKSQEAVVLNWKTLSANNIKTIKLYRQKEEQTPILLKEFTNKDTSYKDIKLSKGSMYYYSFYAVLMNGENILLNNNISIKW